MTAAQIAQQNGNLVGRLIESSTSVYPEMDVLAARSLPIGDLTYNTLVRTALPTISFVPLGGAGTHDESEFAIKEQTCYHIKKPYQAIKDTMERFDAKAGAGSWLTLQQSGVLKAAMALIGSKVWYGNNTSNADEFQGVKNFLPMPSGTASGAFASGVFNVGGSTSTTGSSIYAVHEMESEDDPENFGLVLGNGFGFNLSEPILQSVTITRPDSSTGSTLAWVGELVADIGLQIGLTGKSVVRATNVTADSGHTATDDVFAELYSQMAIGQKPTKFFCSRRTVRQLQKSRGVAAGALTVINSAGQALTAPMPVEWNGIPIIATDSILDTDAIES